MKLTKLFTLFLAVLLLAGLTTGCSSTAGTITTEDAGHTPNVVSPFQPDGYELALITDAGTVDDKAFNQGAWEGLKAYADEFSIFCNYYQPVDDGISFYLDAVALAVEGGAKIIVTPGFLFEESVYIAQEQYPEVHFILLDGTPHDENDENTRIAPNTVSVSYAEEQSGFLAGYAAVKDGYRRLGFMGGVGVPQVVRFGYGFVQGADCAAVELGLNAGDVTLKYNYTNVFWATPEVQTMAGSWYNGGVEVIFACGGAMGSSVVAAAQAADAKVIGVDIDQSGESDVIITSAMKELSISVYDCIKAYYDGNFPGGQNITFRAENNGVGLPMDTSRFNLFTQDEYDAVYARLANESIRIFDDTTGNLTASDVPVEVVDVTVVD